MRSTVVVLALLLGSGCGDDDDSTPQGGTAGTSEGTGVGDVAAPGEDTGEADETGESSGGLSTPDDDDSSGSGGEPEGFGESFEDVLVGGQPGAPWLDIAERIDDPTVPSPTATVIDTIGADGEPTQALQLQDAIGTSQGIFAEIDPAAHHRVTANIRVDQYTDAVDGVSWPIALGLAQSGTGGDPSDDPHALVSVHADGSWHLRILNGRAGDPELDMTLLFPEVELDRWYEVSLEAETATGSFRVELSDPATGELLGEQVALAPVWDVGYAAYDAIAFFDGEYGVRGAPRVARPRWTTSSTSRCGSCAATPRAWARGPMLAQPTAPGRSRP